MYVYKHWSCYCSIIFLIECKKVSYPLRDYIFVFLFLFLFSLFSTSLFFLHFFLHICVFSSCHFTLFFESLDALWIHNIIFETILFCTNTKQLKHFSIAFYSFRLYFCLCLCFLFSIAYQRKKKKNKLIRIIVVQLKSVYTPHKRKCVKCKRKVLYVQSDFYHLLQ